MKEIAELLKKMVKELFDVEIDPEVSIPEEQFGDYATNVALVLSKKLSRPPRETAQEIINELSKDLATDAEFSIAGPGFINIKVSDKSIVSELNKLTSDPDQYGASNIYGDKVVVTEFSDPNPFKVLHMGHFYTSVVGDSISKLIEAAGGKVHRVNFGGDVGLHAAKTVWAIIENLGGENPEKLADVPKGERPDWLSKRYVEGNNAYSDDENAKTEIVDVNKRLYKITADNDRESELAKIFWEARQWSYDSFDEFYDRVGVKFEKYYPESEGAEIGLKAVLSHPEIFTKSDGAIVFKGEKYGLHTRVFINSEGLPTYETKDLGCDLQKYEDYHFDEQVIITGNDIIEYMKVVLKSLEQFAPEIALSTKHMTHGMLKLPGGVKQSSRLGNFVRATDVLDMVADAQERIQGNRDHETVLGAIKYSFLKNRLGPDVIFDPETSVSMTGSSGPYLQYSLARAKSILRKLPDITDVKLPEEQDLDSFERSLATKLISFREVINQATEELAPHLICTYLYELAQVFNRFYENAKVEGDPRQVLRTQLVSMYIIVMTRGLNLLGIPVMEKM